MAGYLTITLLFGHTMKIIELKQWLCLDYF